MLRLPRLSSVSAVVDSAGKPNGTFIQWWQQVVTLIERAIALIVELTGIQDQFEKALREAQQATADAQAAATAAQAAADAAQSQTDATKRETALQTSYISPRSVLSADGDSLTITVASHTRFYGDGTSVSVTGDVLDATGIGDIDYVAYDDPMRAGGAVSYYVVTTNPVQSGDTHVVGAVRIPEAGTSAGGDGPSPPGTVSPLTS